MSSPIVHRERILELISPLTATQSVPLARLLERPAILTESVRSPIDVPGFDNSSMDGYAVAAATLDSAVPSPIPVRGRVAAGSSGSPVAAGTAVEIMTGAPLPEGTDTIVPIEATQPGTFDAPEISIDTPAASSNGTHPHGVQSRRQFPHKGDYVRRRGSDVSVGDTVLTAGTILTPAHLGVAAACGITELPVLVPPTVLIVSTGDEIARATDTDPALGAASIHDSNSITLGASLLRMGVAVTTLRIPDDPQALLEAVRSSTAELVISTGGVSKGAHEVVKLAALADASATMSFEAIAMQPGGPQGWGTMAGKTWVALPGNPVSALVSFELFIRPALLGLDPDVAPREEQYLPLAADLDETPPAGKLQVRRASLGAEGLVMNGGSRSHLLRNYAESTHLAFIPPGHEVPRAGDRLLCWRIQ